MKANSSPWGMMKRLVIKTLDFITRILFGYPTDSWEFTNSVLAMSWGVWVGFVVPDLFFIAPELYQHMMFLPQWLWGGLMILLGVVSFAALFVPRYSMLREFTSILMAVAWATIAWALILIDWQLTSTPMYVVPAVMSALTAVRLRLYRLWKHTPERVKGSNGTKRVQPPRNPIGRLSCTADRHMEQLGRWLDAHLGRHHPEG